MAQVKFRTVIESNGKTATGFRVPAELVERLGSHKRPPVLVTIGKYTYRSTIAVMGGEFLIPLSAENRTNAGVAAGDEVSVGLALDTEPREVAVPEDLAAALADDPAAARTFDGLSYSQKKWYVQPIVDAKKPETRERRLTKAIAMLHEGRTR